MIIKYLPKDELSVLGRKVPEIWVERTRITVEEK